MSETVPSAALGPRETPGREITRLRDLSPQQWKSGIAAWLGWLFDGLDMHLYTIVATPFVAQLLSTAAAPVGEKDPAVGYYSSVIQAAFLVGWALGGGLFGRAGDRLGRARALMLTILTYAVFTGASFFAQTWWHLLICRFLAALGIGGEWAVGASLLSETWPHRWRPWIAAVLQSAVNVGVLLAMLAMQVLMLFTTSHRCVFLVGILPALVVVWIRRAVPEPEEWRDAKSRARHAEPGLLDLFRGGVRRTTVLVILVCAFSLTAHWAFMFWFLQHLWGLPDLASWGDADKKHFLTMAMILVMVTSILGNFVAAAVAKLLGYRRTIALGCVAYFLAMLAAYAVVRDHAALMWWFVPIGVCQGLFGLFTMYLPPLFPTLLRTTGAGFCYNIGRIVAAVGTVVFGLLPHLGDQPAAALDHRLVLLYAAFMFLPAAAAAVFLPELPDRDGAKPRSDPGSHTRLHES